MGERVFVQLDIGGSIPFCLLDELVVLINDEMCETDVTRGTFQDAADDEEIISLYFHECNYGSLGELDTFLKNHNLMYTKWIGSGCNFESSIEGYHPRFGYFSRLCNEDGSEMIPRQRVLEAFAELKTRTLLDVDDIISHYFGPEIPDMEPVSISFDRIPENISHS